MKHRILIFLLNLLLINFMEASPRAGLARRRRFAVAALAPAQNVLPKRRDEASKLRAIYINLDHRADRRSHMERLLKGYLIPHTRFSAVNGMEIKNYLIGNEPYKFELLNGTAFHPDVLKPYIWKGNGHYGRIGCWQSHVQVLLQIIQEVEEKGFPDAPVLVLEDDITWPSSFGRQGLINHMEVLPNDWEMIIYGMDGRVCVPGAKKPLPEFCRIIEGYRAHAYVVRNVSVAKKLLSVLNTTMPQCLDYGWHKAFGGLVAYGSRGSITQKDNMGSNIPESGFNWIPKEKFWHKG